MIKVSAGLSRKVGEANYSSRYGSAGVGTISIRQIALGGISWVSWSLGKTLKAISKGCREPELLPRVQVIPKGFELFQLSFQGIE